MRTLNRCGAARFGFAWALILSFAQCTTVVAVPQGDRELARDSLNFCQEQVKGHPDWFEHANGLVKAYREAWGALDLDEAIRIDEHPAHHGHRTRLLYRLVYAAAKPTNDRLTRELDRQSMKEHIRKRPNITFKDANEKIVSNGDNKKQITLTNDGEEKVPVRFADILRVAKRNEPNRTWYLLRFWPRVAEFGASYGDAEMVEFAAAQFEDLATRIPLKQAAPPLPSLDVRAGRFFIAAARLESLRNNSEVLQPKNEKLRKQIWAAAGDLWHAANAFGPFDLSLGMPSVRHWESCPDYAALEMWNVREAPRGWELEHIEQNRPQMGKQLDTLLEIVDLRYYWPRVALPELGAPVVTPWVHRQVHMGRHDVAIAYLAKASGDPLDRARLLAVIAQGLAKSDVAKANVCRDVAELLIASSANRQHETRPVTDLQWRNDSVWTRVEAKSELAIAYHAAEMEDAAKGTARYALEDFQSIVSLTGDPAPDPKNLKQHADSWMVKVNYDSLNALLLATAKMKFSAKEVPEPFVFAAGQRGFHLMTAEQYPLKIRDVRRVADISRIVPTPKSYVYDSHRPYYRSISKRQWREATVEVQRLAEGNPAWRSSFYEIGAKSVQDIGLEKTLQWSESLENVYTRMAVELGAIRAAIEPELKRSVPRIRDIYSPTTIAPGIRWPSSGC